MITFVVIFGPELDQNQTSNLLEAKNCTKKAIIIVKIFFSPCFGGNCFIKNNVECKILYKNKHIRVPKFYVFDSLYEPSQVKSVEGGDIRP